MEHVCVTVCVSVIEHSCVLTRSMQVHGCVIHRAQSQRQESHGSGKSHRTTATGLPGVGGRLGIRGADHVDKHKHKRKRKCKYTYTYTHTHTHTYGAIPFVLVVPCAAFRPCHCLPFSSPLCVLFAAFVLFATFVLFAAFRRHSSLSLPFVLFALVAQREKGTHTRPKA